MKIVSITASYQRPEITIDTLNLFKNQKYLVKSILVGSSLAEQKAAEQVDAVYVNHANHPLGSKWQAGVDKARELNPDAILICGSDDWLTSNWCEVCSKEIEKGFDLVGKTRWCLCDVHPGKSLQLFRIHYKVKKRKDPIGSGRLISRKVLDKLNWELFPKNKDKYLDWESWTRIKKAGGTLKLLDNREDIWAMCIKSTWKSKSNWITSKKNSQCIWGEVANPKEWIGHHYPGAPIDKYLK